MAEAPEKRPLTARDLWSLKFVGEPELSPDGSCLVWVQTWINAKRNSYESAIWMSRRTEGGGFEAPRRLTYGRRTDQDWALDKSPRFSPDGRYLAFLSNRSGKNQIWILDMKYGGEARQLTNLDESPSQIQWSPDSRYIAFVAKDPKPKEETRDDEIRTDRDVTVVTRLRYKANGVPGVLDNRNTHVYVVDVASGEVRQVTFGPYDDSNPVFSPDGQLIAFTSCREPNRELVNIPDLWTVPFAGGEPTRLTFGKGPVHAPSFSPDGRFIAYFGHESGEDGTANVGVRVVPREGGQIVNLTPGFNRSVGCGISTDARFDSGSAGPFWSRDSKYVYFIATDRGYSGIYRTSIENPCVELVAGAVPGNIRTCAKFPPVIVSMAFKDLGDEKVLLAFNGSTPLNPGDIYAVSVPKECGGDPSHTCSFQQVTRVNEELLSSVALSEPEAFTFRSRDGLEIEGWMMKPIGYQSGQKYPAIIEIHGGPHSAYGNAFFFEFQLLASRGYGVFYSNPRGSSGYGEEFARKVIGDWGGMDYQDIMSLKDYADKVEWVDNTRMGVTGGSYGGYMVNWIVGHTDRFQAAVTQRSISNMYSKYGTSDIGWYGNKRGMGGRDLWDSESFLMERSPIRYAPFVKTPILILHSEQDYRCPMEQAEQWYVALKRLGKEVEFVRFAGENHELSRSGKPWNRVERLERIVGWFDRYLKK